MSETVFLSLGSNIGSSEQILARAVSRLAERLRELSCSSLYSSAPREVVEQPRFLNCAVRGAWDDDPYALLVFCQSIERDFGRDRSAEMRKGPRSLDIDIVLFGQARLRDERLIVPHPSAESRKFVLLPVLELDADATWPGGTPLGAAASLSERQGIYPCGALPYNSPTVGTLAYPSAD